MDSTAMFARVVLHLPQSSQENSGPQQVADPLWERLKALVRDVLALLQTLLLEHAGQSCWKS